uniref:Uncharacterized protein n=1 Tax=Fagus sylvatica TaxID=28930 RepID=A0A2N9FKQ1_FAGSY
MAPGSRGRLELFLCTVFPAKIPVKRGMLSANREFHVVAGVVIFPTHPGSHGSTCCEQERLCARRRLSGRKSTRFAPSAFFLKFLSQFARVPDSRESELGSVRYGSREQRPPEVFLVRLRDSFPIGIPARPGKILGDPRVPRRAWNVSSFQRARARGSTCCESGRLCAQAWQRRWENSGNFSTNLISSACFHARGRRSSRCRISTILVSSESLRATYFSTVQALHRGELGFARYDLANRGRRNVPYAKGFDHNSLVSRPFLARKVSNRSSHHVLQNGQGAVSSIQLSVWSNGPSSWGHLMWRAFVGSGRLGSGCLVLRAYTRENPVGTAKNLPQFTCHSLSDTLALNRLTHGSKVKVGFRFLVFSLNSTFPTSAFSFPSSSDLALRKFVRLSEVIGDLKFVRVSNLVVRRFGILNPNTSRSDLTWGLPKLQIGPNKLRSDLTWGLPKLQIGWFNGLESQSKQVEGCKSGGSTVWNLSPNKLRSDLTWGLPKLQIGWFNGLESQSKQVEGDLTWGLPKLQIGWFNGLESQSKQVEGCKSGGSTVWNLSPNKLRGDLTWGLPKLQIGWFNGLESQSKQVEDCKSGGSTVWNLSPNKLRSDLTWGLPKLQIGWFNGLESQSKQVEGCKSGGSTVWNLSPNKLRGDLTWGLPKLQIGWFNGLESQSKQVEDCKSGGSTVWNLSPNKLRSDLTWGLPKLQIGWFNGLESQSKQVEGCKSGGSTVWNLSPNRLRSDLTWGLPKLQIGWFNGLESQSKQVEDCKSGGSTVWNLSPNKLRSDLTWGLPKLQIGWFNGLESQSKQVEDCKSGGSTVWNLSPNKLRSDLTWGLPKLQIGWFNGLESQSKQVEDCKSGGSTVWNLSPNKLRSDLTWGLPKLQIGWFNGLESQSKQVEGCKSGGSTVWNLSPNKLRSDLTWGLPKLQIGCLTDVVVAEIVAGPHALDSCECMNIEGQILRKT